MIDFSGPATPVRSFTDRDPKVNKRLERLRFPLKFVFFAGAKI